MKIRLTELKRIIRSEIKMSLKENFSNEWTMKKIHKTIADNPELWNAYDEISDELSVDMSVEDDELIEQFFQRHSPEEFGMSKEEITGFLYSVNSLSNSDR